jgi:hypothetical protein
MLSLPPERLIALHLDNKSVLIGRAEQVADNWVRFATPDGVKLVNLNHVTLIDLNDGLRDPGPQVDEGLARPRSKDIPLKVGSKAPGRPWNDDDLKQLSEGFLDGENDAQLAERFHRTRGQIRDLRQGFECNRGNHEFPIDQNPAASLWVDRWQKVLSRGRE